MDTGNRDLFNKVIVENSPFTVKRIYLYGSRARGDNREDSDTDLIVELDEVTKEQSKEFYAAVIGKLPEGTDLKVLNYAPWYLAYWVGKEGIEIYSDGSIKRGSKEHRATGYK